MSRFINREQRTQSVLFPEQLEDWIAEENPVRAVDAFVDELDLPAWGLAVRNRQRRVGLHTTPRRC